VGGLQIPGRLNYLDRRFPEEFDAFIEVGLINKIVGVCIDQQFPVRAHMAHILCMGLMIFRSTSDSNDSEPACLDFCSKGSLGPVTCPFRTGVVNQQHFNSLV
jgi:hypothetical protein